MENIPIRTIWHGLTQKRVYIGVQIRTISHRLTHKWVLPWITWFLITLWKPGNSADVYIQCQVFLSAAFPLDFTNQAVVNIKVELLGKNLNISEVKYKIILGQMDYWQEGQFWKFMLLFFLAWLSRINDTGCWLWLVIKTCLVVTLSYRNYIELWWDFILL